MGLLTRAIRPIRGLAGNVSSRVGLTGASAYTARSLLAAPQIGMRNVGRAIGRSAWLRSNNKLGAWSSRMAYRAAWGMSTKTGMRRTAIGLGAAGVGYGAYHHFHRGY